MIKHIVMWDVRGETAQERREAALFLKGCFESLVGRIPGLLHLEVGLDISAVEYACDVVLYTEFEDQAALEGYATHPEHMRVRTELGVMRIARHQVDYAVSVHGPRNQSGLTPAAGTRSGSSTTGA